MQTWVRPAGMAGGPQQAASAAREPSARHSTPRPEIVAQQSSVICFQPHKWLRFPLYWLHFVLSLPHIFKCAEQPASALNSSHFINPNVQELLFTPRFQHDIEAASRKLILSLYIALTCRYVRVSLEVQANCLKSNRDLIRKNVCLGIFKTFLTSNNLASFTSESTFPLKLDSRQVTEVYGPAGMPYREGWKGQKRVAFAWKQPESRRGREECLCPTHLGLSP